MKGVELSVSSSSLKCQDIVRLLYQVNIPASITSNVSLVGHPLPPHSGSNCVLVEEHGCRVLFNKINKRQLKEEIWQPLAVRYDLKCAHLMVPSVFNGCIHNFFNQKKCD